MVLIQRDFGTSLIFFAAANYDDLVPAILFGHCRETSQAIRDHKLNHYNAEILDTRFLSVFC